MGKVLRVLQVEDSENDATLVLHELRRGGFDPIHERVDTKEDFLDALNRVPWDLVLSDFSMPRFNGLDAFDLLMKTGLDIPFIFVSGRIGEDMAAEAMRRGAKDYVLKDKLARLNPAIERELREAAARRAALKMKLTLNATEHRLSAIFNTVGDVIFELAVEPNEVFRFSAVNQAFTKVTGVPVEQVIGKRVDEIIPPSTLPLVLAKYREAIASRQIMRWEETSDYPTGRLTGEVSMVPNFDGTGACTHLVGAVHDITERKRAEQALRASQRLLQTVFDTIPHALMVKDREGRYLMVNRAWLERYNLAAEDVLGVQTMNIPGRAEADRRKAFEEDRAVFESGQPVAFEGIGTIREGQRRHFHTIKAPLRDEAGQITGLVGVVADTTEIMRAGEALQTSQRLLQTVFDTIPHHLIVKDRESRYLMVNKAWCETFGRTPAEILHRTAMEVSGRPRDELERILAEDRRVLDGESILTPMQPTLTVKTGQKRFFSGVKTPLRDETGEIVGLVAAAMDVTPEMEARQKAESAHAHLIDAIESLPAAFYMYDPQERLVLWNSRTGEFYPELLPKLRPGISFEEVVRITAETGVPEAQGQVDAWVRRRVEQFRNRPGIFEQKLPDGRWLQGIDRRTSDGGTVSLRFDVTERKRQELEVQQSEARYRTLVEESLQGLLIVQGGKIAFCNGATVRMFGYGSAAEMIGMDAITVVHPEDRHRALEVGSEEMRAGDPRLYRYYRGVRKDGSHMRYEAHRSETQWQGRRAVQWAMMDVTQEFALQQQLESSQRMESVGRLAGGIAHDFNNILTVILAHIGFILDGLVGSPALQEDARVVQDAGVRAAGLTRQLLAFSRRQILEMRIVNLNDLVTGTEKMLSRVIGEDINLRTVLEPALRPIRADVTQIEQVMMNLVVNARDAMPRGGSIGIETANVTLDDAYYRARLEVRPGDYVMLVVTDTGTGMDPETQKRIFEPFFTTKPQGQGTGLGLATVYGIVKQMNGSIFVYSELNKGTTFKIYFPVALDVATDGAPESAKSPAIQPTETILLVEDDELVRRSAQRILGAAGYRVIVTASPEEALAIARAGKESFDLLLTDVVMPGMGGSDLWEAIRQVRDVRVLFMSGYTDDTVVRHGVLEGEMPYLSKPFTKKSLLDKVREVIHHAG